MAPATTARASASAADLTNLTARRLLFVTGKGGTGKSTIAAALAVRAAGEGKRVLVCEMDAKGSVAGALGAARATFEPVEVRPGLHVMSMDTEASLREYMRIHLRIPLVTRIGPLAATFDFVADAAPGVKEVLAVGKVCWEVRENHYDLVVVDAEASGHVVAQIASPRTITSLVPRGPLREQTSWMLDILDDPARTGVVVVSTPEELPVTESFALVARLREETHTDIAAVILNRAEPAMSDSAVALALDPWFASRAPHTAAAALVSHRTATAQQEHAATLRTGVPGIPLLTVGSSPLTGSALVEQIAGELNVGQTS